METSSSFSTLLSNHYEDTSTIWTSSFDPIGNSTILNINNESSTTSIPRLVYIGTFFSWYDYLIFTALLSLSCGIGTYFGCFGKKQTTKDYLHAGGNMQVLPVVISLLTGECGQSLLAISSEVYVYGANFWLCAISYNLVTWITIYVYLPVFYKLKLNSMYEYLDLRFDAKTRKLSAILFTIKALLHLPILIYTPALVFSTASGLDKNIVIPVVCGICIFYTASGGLKALIWSDTLLFLCTVGALLAVLILGINKGGGLPNVFNLASEGQRMVTFDFDLDFTKRDPFWAIVIGHTVKLISLKNTHQRNIQKYLSVPTLKKAKLLVFFYCSMTMPILKTLCVLLGLAMYANFAKCDPLTSKKISHNNEILPYFVLDVARNIPCLSGIFIAVIFCTHLSSFSTNLNSVSATVYEDFVKSKLSEEHQRNSIVFLRSFVVIVGIIATALAYTVEYFDGILSLTIKLTSISLGPLLGLFTLGFLFPRATSNGAFYGSLTSTIFMIILSVGSQYFSHLIKTASKPISTEDCFNYTNSTLTSTPTSTVIRDNVPAYLKIFSISFYWYFIIGTLICMMVALIISYLSEENDPPVARELLSPIIYGIIDKDKYVDVMDLNYCSIDEALSRIDGTMMDQRSKTREEVKEEFIYKK